jgi:tRNA threonylcarbamoyl adenosine modification protein YeaZ
VILEGNVMNVLGIDSSTGYLSVAVSRGGRLISEVVSRAGSRHMVNIMGMLNKALKKSKLELKDIDVFGVNHGPGDFTGTRIGVSVIKMLAFLEKKPVFGINSLDAIAVGVALKNISRITGYLKEGFSPVIMPCLDVRKKEVYFAFYIFSSFEPNGGSSSCIARVDSKGTAFFIKKEGENVLVRYDKLEALLDKLLAEGILKVPGASPAGGSIKIIIGGNCYLSYRETVTRIIKKDRIFLLDRKTAYPRAGYVNACAYYNLLKKTRPKNLTAFYVREFVPFGNINKDSGSL